MELIIAKASIDEAEEIIAFLNKVGGETDFLTFGLNEFPYSLIMERQIISECLKDDTSLILVGKVSNQIVSQLFLEVSSQKRLSHLGSFGISVSKDYWQQSIATRMLTEAIAWAKGKNMAKLQLQVRTDNTHAVQLYKKLGFVVEGTITRSLKIKEVYFDEYLMGLELPVLV
jgi:RimJ/RimL family protein N-acetyltransferase